MPRLPLADAERLAARALEAAGAAPRTAALTAAALVAAEAEGRQPESFWSGWQQRKAIYAERLT